MKQYGFLKVFYILLVIPFLSNCNYLDVDSYFSDTLPYDSIFHNRKNLEKYLWGTAALFPNESNIIGNNYTPGPLATDEGFILFDQAGYRGIAFSLGEVTPTNMYGMDIWGDMYKIIRKSNILLTRMDEATDLTKKDKDFLMGYSHFMRGYAYYNLLMQYGPFVIVGDDVLETNESKEYYDMQRATYDESADYVCNELGIAADFLPLEVPMNDFERPTKGAALALIARVRLQQASPAFNGKSASRMYFGNWVRKSDGKNYVSQTYDEYKWVQAAYSAKKVIDLKKYKLHTVNRQANTRPLPNNVSTLDFPNGAGNIDPFKSYSEMFTGETPAVRNEEFIWYKEVNPYFYVHIAFPGGIMQGRNGLCVTQKIIDAYYMEDGNDIHNSSAEYPYSEVGRMGGGGITFSDYFLPGSVHKMYVNREMRFYASIGFSECMWKANSTSDNSLKNFIATYYANGTSGINTEWGVNKEAYPITGYVLKKFVHPDDAVWGTGAQVLKKTYPIIRYAEVILSYVEALNNLTNSYVIEDEDGNSYTFSRDVEEIKFYFNQIRYRAGLRGLTDNEVSSPETVQKLIERERMLEFLFENRRYFDVRRWGIYEDTEKELMMGMNTEGNAGDYYQRVPINSSKVRNRVVDKKLMFLPINFYEIRKAPSLDQNPGYDN